MINSKYFTDRAFQVGFNSFPDSHHINYSFSKLTVKPNYIEIGIETRYVNKILREMATIYSRLKNQYKPNYQTVFSARFDKQDEDGQMLDEIDLYINLNFNQILTTGSDINFFDMKTSIRKSNSKARAQR